MPAVSEAQRRAMFAAAEGHSTLGIPKSVGKEFADADQGGKLPKRVKKHKRSGEEPSIAHEVTRRLGAKDR